MIDRKQLTPVIAPAVGVVAPAVSLAVKRYNETIFAGVWGEATNGTLFDIASLTKLFTATVVLSLLEREGLRLETPLVDLVPGFGAISPRPIAGGQNPHTRERLSVNPALDGETVNPADVTLWHLLTHTSGLPPWRDVYGFAAPDAPLSREERWRHGMARIMAYSFVDRVGANVHYSDIGYMLLGEVASRLYGAPLDKVIQEQVLAPLLINEVVMFNPLTHGFPLEKIAATQYDETWRGRRVHGEVHDENAYGLGGVSGHAGLFGTALGVAEFGHTWCCNALSRVPGVSQTLRDRAVSEQVNIEGTTRRSLGWELYTPGSSAGSRLSNDAFGHTGFTGTSLWVDPSSSLTVALLTNRVYYGRHHEGIHEFRRAVHDHIADIIDQ